MNKIKEIIKNATLHSLDDLVSFNTISTININNMKNINNIIPVLTYVNMNTNKSDILLNNKQKSGIYRITNLTNCKIYIGSSNNLSLRFRVYFNTRRLMNSNMHIYRAILKTGHSNFRLDILEYCDPKLLIGREQYYMDLFKPEYNTLKIAGSSLGFKHTENTRTQMSINNTGVNHPLFGKTLTNETRIKIGKAKRLNTTIDLKPSLDTKGSRLSTIKVWLF